MELFETAFETCHAFRSSVSNPRAVDNNFRWLLKRSARKMSQLSELLSGFANSFPDACHKQKKLAAGRIGASEVTGEFTERGQLKTIPPATNQSSVTWRLQMPLYSPLGSWVVAGCIGLYHG